MAVLRSERIWDIADRKYFICLAPAAFEVDRDFFSDVIKFSVSDIRKSCDDHIVSACEFFPVKISVFFAGDLHFIFRDAVNAVNVSEDLVLIKITLRLFCHADISCPYSAMASRTRFTCASSI